MIHEADAPFLRSRRAHVDEYLAGRGRYLGDAAGEAKVTAAANAVISGEMEPTLLVRGGETISLGGDVAVCVRSVPGHTAGSLAYVIDGQRSVSSLLVPDVACQGEVTIEAALGAQKLKTELNFACGE